MANKVKALQQWCAQQVMGYRDVNVTNMTSSWKSGLAFCALIHRYRPDLIDYDSLSKENVYENNELAFRVAKEKLNVPDLLDAEDMVAMRVPDKLCIVTYVSQYYNVLRSLSPAGGPGVQKVATKRPSAADPPGGTEPKRISTDPSKAQENQSKAVSGPRGGHKQSMGDKCHICSQKVYLMERHLEGGKLYHRHCFRESQKSSFRAYRGSRHQDSKENISPDTDKHNNPSNLTSNETNGNEGATTKNMARFWDSKISGPKRLPSPSSNDSSPPVEVGSPEKKTGYLKKTEPPIGSSSDHLLKSRTPKPWSAISDQSSANSSGRQEAFSPVQSPLSPGANNLFPHYNASSGGRSIPSAAVESMEVDPVAGESDNNHGAASVMKPTRTTVLPPPSSQPALPPSRSRSPPSRPSRPRSPGPSYSIPESTPVTRPRSPPPAVSFSSATRSPPSRSRSPPLRPRSPLPSVSIPSAPRSSYQFASRSRSPPPSASRAVPAPSSLGRPMSPPAAGSRSPPPSRAMSPPSAGARSPLSARSHSPPAARARSPTSSRARSPLSPSARPLSPSTPQSPADANVFNGLLQSLSNIRQRHDPEPNDNTKEKQSPEAPTPPSINGVQNSRSILKHGSNATAEVSPPSNESQTVHLSNRGGPRPILKHKDPVSATIACDQPKPSDNTNLKSILKTGFDSDTGSSSLEPSPRSILKRHDEEESSDNRQGILKTPDFTLGIDSSYDHSTSSPRSILKAGGHDIESSPSIEDGPKPGRSILKPRKPSGDSLLSSSGDELDDLSPRPILKTSPRSENVVSPTNDIKSILKTKNISSQSPTNSTESPKPILKSRENSPAPMSSSPLKVMEPTKRVVKKNVESPTPTKSSLSQPAKSPSGPSVLRTNATGKDKSNSKSSFAAFKSPSNKSYTSAIAIGNEKTLNVDSHRPTAKPRKLDSKQNNGARPKTGNLESSKQEGSDDRPEWMKEAEKRQAARGGKYVDPEKKHLDNTTTKSSTMNAPARPFSPPRPLVKVGMDKKKASTIDRPNPVKKTSPRREVAMEVDVRPEWQREAEKRTAARKGFYPDPEKVPMRKKTPEPERILSNGKDTVEKPSNGAEHPRNKPLEKLHMKPDRVSAMGPPPPKPLRSPLPNRGHRVISNNVTENSKSDDTEKERMASIRKHPSILQRNKKSPPPPRPAAPPQVGKKKIVPGDTFTFDEAGGLTHGVGLYAEVGPPSRNSLAVNGSSSPNVNRFSHRPLPPLPPSLSSSSGDDTPTPKRKVQAEVHIATSALMSRLEELDVHLQGLEQEGRVLEEKIRSESDDAMDEADLMIAWFELVNKKNDLVRQESDLMYRQRQQDLETQHEELEYELRCIMEKGESEKTPSERVREEALLQELIETVIQRNYIVDSIEEDRIRYLEEDEEIAVMMHKKGLSLKDESLLDGCYGKKKGHGKKKEDKKKKRERVKSSIT